MAMLLNGKELADKWQEQLREEVGEWAEQGLRLPKLVVILIGENEASQVYVRNKERAAKKIGFHSLIERLPENTGETVLLDKIKAYNQDPTVDGILVQLPLPDHIDEEKVLLAIAPAKDVDGFHPMNMGKLFVGQPDKYPCTPYGILMLLKENDIPIEGKHAVIIGRSNIVGKPMAQLLLDENATITIAHSKTPDLKAVAREADILVVAIGRGEMITSDYVKPGAVVVDVGMNRNVDGKLVGDVDFEDVLPVASYITPVPGGVGPMTITMLMEQTVDNVRKEHGK